MRLPELAHKVANFLLFFYLSAALFKLIQAVTFFVGASSLMLGIEMIFRGMDLLLTGSTFWLLLKSMALLLTYDHDREVHHRATERSNSHAEDALLLFRLEMFIKIFPFAMILLSVPEIFRLYQVLSSLGIIVNRTLLAGLAVIIGGGLIALQIGFWYLILQAVKIVLLNFAQPKEYLTIPDPHKRRRIV